VPTHGSNPSRRPAHNQHGNRLTETGTAASTYSIAPSSNRITGITGALARSYAYDAAGNTTGYSTVTASYNNAGRLQTLTNGASTETSVYNALGQRIRISGGINGTVLYSYDEAGHLLGEYDGTGTLIEETVWLGDIPVATLRPNGATVAVYYIHSDPLNTPRQVTRPSDNTPMWTWNSDPFGTDAANPSPSGAGIFAYNLRFPGQVFDGQAGLHYNYFRDYDPAVGRYVESDPIGLNGGVNTYLYARATPLALSDMLGLCPDDPDKCQKLLDEIQKLIDARRVKPTDPKGMAQRYAQLARTGKAALPADVRAGYIEQFTNQRTQLRTKIEDYINNGCGDPPPGVLDWANKEVPTLPVQVPDSSEEEPGGDQSNSFEILLWFLLRSARIAW
jgi:RHS repeat-associated protein